MKNYIKISFKLQYLVVAKYFNIIHFKLQLSNLNLKHTLIPKYGEMTSQIEGERRRFPLLLYESFAKSECACVL